MSIDQHKMRLVLTGICIAAFLVSYSQTSLIDSLEQRLQIPDLDGQEKVDLMNTLSFQHHRRDLSKAFSYAKAALALANEISYRKGVGDAHHSLGINLWEKRELDSALVSYEEAILIYDELGLVEKGIRSRMNKAIIFENKDDFPNAISQYERALVLIKENNIEGLAAVISYNMGLVYNKMGDWVTAIDRYLELLDHAQKTGNKAYEISAWQSIGNTYMKLEYPENAFQAFKNALKIASLEGNKRQEADARRGLGRVLSLNNQLG